MVQGKDEISSSKISAGQAVDRRSLSW